MIRRQSIVNCDNKARYDNEVIYNRLGYLCRARNIAHGQRDVTLVNRLS